MKLHIDEATREPPEGFDEVDATRLRVGEVQLLGPLDPDVDLVELAVALLTSCRVITYIHAWSELELAPTADGVRVVGTHTYFTNCRNDAPLEFFLERVGGQLRIRGA